MAEYRTKKRRHLLYYLTVIDGETEEPVGFLVDITTNGLMIMSDAPIETEKFFHLKILLQTELTEKEYLNFDAVSKRSVKGVNSDFYDTGFELIDLTREDFKEIEEIIEALGLRD